MGIFPAQEVNVKCRAMYARLLTERDYDAMIPMKSVSQVGVYLKKHTPYAYFLRRIDENDIRREQIEQALARALFYDYERLVKFSGDGIKSAIGAMFEAYEIEDLKHVIGSICSNRKQSVTSDDLPYVQSYGNLSDSPAIAASTMKELTESLAHTRYYKPLLPFASAENPDFIEIDHALNLLNYKDKLNAFKKNLRGKNRRIAVSILGAKNDLANITFIYRVIKLFNFAPKDILAHLMPCEHKVSYGELFKMAECKNTEELINLIGKSYYGFLFPKGKESEWEKLQSEYFYKIHVKNLRMQNTDFGAAVSYLYLREIDIRNIVMLIEGVRYKLPASSISTFLVGGGRPAAGAFAA